MAKRTRAGGRRKKKGNLGDGAAGEKVKDYRHEEKRPNNPPAGLATYDKTPPSRKVYDYDPHLDPQLVWAGKKEHTSFELENVALHIHERISTAAIMRAVQREPLQRDLFADPQFPLTEQIEFYQHPMNWANRLILGDSLLVMNSLLERELMAGKVQMIYVDPPYGVKFSSNFQPRIDRRDVRDSDEDLTREPEMIKAYRDTWTLGVHSYLTYLRDRLLLCRELLADSGSIFVQIGDQNLHHARELMEEIFGCDNFVGVVTFRTKIPLNPLHLANVADFLLWYAKEKEQMKFRRLCVERGVDEILSDFRYVELQDGSRRFLTEEERTGEKPLPPGSRLFTALDLSASGYTASCDFPVEYDGKTYYPTAGKAWKTNPDGMQRLLAHRRVHSTGRALRYVFYAEDYPVKEITNIWTDTLGEAGKAYVTQSPQKALQRCILMTTDPGELVLDPTCGSGTTAYIAEKLGRRWITCDTSRVALALARQRILTATFPYYRLGHPEKGVSGGFIYKTVPHITLGSIAQNEPSERAILYALPEIDRSKVRVSGPFSVEAIPVPAMEDVAAIHDSPLSPDARQDDLAQRGRGQGRIVNPAADHITTMIELLRKAGVVFPGGKKLMLENLRPLGVGWLHAEAEAKQDGEKARRVAVSFGPRHGPVTAMQTHEAAQTASVNGYDVLVLAGFSVDPEAQAFIQKTPIRNLTVHFANVNPDVLVGDLLKTSRASQLFTVFGSPDVKLEKQKDGSYIVRLLGVDIYDPNTGELQQSRGEDVAAWFLDQDYDGYTFCISQAFFPANDDAWEKLGRALKGSIDPEKFEALRGTISLPFQPGKYERIAVKVIDFRGNETIRVIQLSQLTK
jgi:adenine-specific DNA-methyltransferase